MSFSFWSGVLIFLFLLFDGVDLCHTRVDVSKRGCVILVCTDGLSKHVTDAEIAQQLGAMQSAEQVCRSLLQLALDRGGSDNITLVVGRALRARPG